MSDFRERARNHLRTAAGTYIGPMGPFQLLLDVRTIDLEILDSRGGSPTNLKLPPSEDDSSPFVFSTTPQYSIFSGSRTSNCIAPAPTNSFRNSSSPKPFRWYFRVSNDRRFHPLDRRIRRARSVANSTRYSSLNFSLEAIKEKYAAASEQTNATPDATKAANTRGSSIIFLQLMNFQL